MSEFSPVPPRRSSFTLPFLVAAALLMAGCATNPDPSFRLETPSISPESSVATFNTEIVPAPGRVDVLDWMHREVTRQMKGLGYKVGEENPDLIIRVKIVRTDQVTTILESVESGRIRLEMKADGKVLRQGHTPHLTTVELNIFSRDTAEEIVAEFLNGFPKRKN